MSLRGPRSALSQFLEEENIKVEKNGNIQNKNEKLQKNTEKNTKLPLKSPKRLKYSHPIEIVNFKINNSIKNLILKKIHSNYKIFKFNDDQIQLYLDFLYENMCLTQEIFDYISKCVKNKLKILDCSMITKFDILKGLKILKLGYCGQLRDSSMRIILKNNPELEILHIKGAFLLENLDLSKHKKLKEVDVSQCSRLNDNFLEQFEKLKNIESLNISNCFGITKKAVLKKNVKKLFLDRVPISKKFFEGIQVNLIEELSISHCPNLFRNKKNRLKFKKFENLKKLNIDGISEIKKLKISNLIELKASNCFSLCLPLKNKNLKMLSLSNYEFSKENLKNIFEFKNLEFLDISFSENVEDQFVLDCLQNLPNLKKIVVFGCFKLTENLGETAWKIKERIQIIGNHSETKYLLNN